MNRRLDHFWFPEAPAARPAVLRVLLGAYVLWYLGSRYRLFLKIARSDRALFKPVGVASLLRQPVPPAVFRRVLIVTLLANAAFMLGWKHRYSGPVFGGLLLWVLSYRNSWSMIYHNDNVLALHALILGVAPAADAYSLDALTRVTKEPSASPLTGVRSGRRPDDSWRYGWPIRLMNSVTVLTYFLSGVAKVAGPLGWGWASGDALRGQVAVDALRKDLLGDGASPLARRLYDKPFFFGVMGFGSLAVELGAPFVLVDRRPARAWAVAAFLMHWGILHVMGIKFRYQLSGLIFAPFFDVERLLTPLDLRRGRPRRTMRRVPSQVTLIFDKPPRGRVQGLFLLSWS